ncbi:MAG: MATE family efflux transporter [Treponema sp.]|nr:MATE family efflux transporter [Treponema sp.]
MNSESKSFYKSLLFVVGPLALQNLISALVNSVDIFMLGSVGQTAIASSSLANQVTFILFMVTTGLSSGLVMLAAQYWGKQDIVSIQTLSGIAFRISASVGLVVAFASFFIPSQIMHFFTDDPNMISVGASYLRAVSFSFLFMSVSQIFHAAFKSVEKVLFVTVLTFVSLGTNVILNGCFLYGWLGFPKMGIVGVGIATSIARFIEMLICIIYGILQKKFGIGLHLVFRRNPLLTKDFFKYSLPAVGNELVWGLAFSMYSVILGRLGEDIVAADSVVNVVRRLGTVLVFGTAYGGAIVLGKYMGAGNLDVAERNSSRLAKVTLATGIFGAILVLCLNPVLPMIADLNETASRYRTLLLLINSYSIIGCAVNTGLICGIFRAGGDSKFGFITDAISMWFVSLPLGLLAAFVFKLSPVWVYFVLYLDEFEKMPIVIVHYFRKTWLKNITRDKNQLEEKMS